MEHFDERTQCRWTSAAHIAASIATSATLLLAVGGAFYSVSHEPVLADSPRARLAIAGCDALDDRLSRQHCTQRLVAEAKVRDAGAAQLAALTAHQRGAGR